VRDVACRTGVAPGTVYHYFTSRDHLPAASMTELLAGLEKSATKVPTAGDTNLYRMIRVLEHVWISALIGWKNGWIPFDQAVGDLKDAAAMLWSGRQ